MTVRQLIKRLEEYNPDLPVHFGYGYDGFRIETVGMVGIGAAIEADIPAIGGRVVLLVEINP